MALRCPPFPSGWSSLPLSPANLSLANTLPVGQSFIWHRRALQPPTVKAESSPCTPPPATEPVEEYSRALDSPPRVVCLRQSPSALYYTAIHPSRDAEELDRHDGTTRRWLEDYFQLDKYPDLPKLYDEWRRDPLFSGVEEDPRAVGVRVLRQDPWECLIAFITSTNNHIPRITSLLHKLSERFSPPLLTLEPLHPSSDVVTSTPDLSSQATTYHLFPPPSALPSSGLEPILRELGFGYRANFIESTLGTLRAAADSTGLSVPDELLRWRALPLEETRTRLVALKGVGRKVADCVMLMCMDQPSLIPIDTHIQQIATRHPLFPSRLRKPLTPALYDDVQRFLVDQWGPLGGWCQAVVFAADLKPRKDGTPKKRKRVEVVEVEEKVVVDGKPLGRTRGATRGTGVKVEEVKVKSVRRVKKAKIVEDEVKIEAQTSIEAKKEETAVKVEANGAKLVETSQQSVTVDIVDVDTKT